MVRGGYDLQAVRMNIGLRLYANFSSKLTDQPAAPFSEDDEMSEEAKKIMVQLKESYKRLTDGIARNRTLPDEKNFKGDELISSFAELTLVDQYIRIETQEALSFRQLHAILNKIPIYTEWLMNQKGVGPAMAGVLITYFNPKQAAHASAFSMYAGLDVAADGAGRSRRREHLVEREYEKKDGTMGTRMSVTYNPFLKTKMVGVLGPSFIKTRSPWRDHYDRYKHRLETDPNRNRINVNAWKKIYAKIKKEKGDEASIADMREYWPPGRIHAASNRYMVKMFLYEFWAKWRELEGLPVTPPYHEGVMGHVHHGKPDPDQPEAASNP
jgi:hypothetical protein